MLERVASLLDGFDKLWRQYCLCDFSAFAHDSRPGREAGVVFGASEGDVVAVVAELAHLIFVDNSPDEAVVGGLYALHARFEVFSLLLAGDGDKIFLFSVERVGCNFHTFRGRFDAVHEEGHNRFSDKVARIVALEQLDLGVEECDILPPSRIGHVFLRGLLLEKLRGNIQVVRQGRFRKTRALNLVY